MKISKSDIPDVLIIQNKVFPDSRGFFYEAWRSDLYQEILCEKEFIQDNVSFSYKNVLRGLHFQTGMGKLVSVSYGCVYDVAVDMRKNSKYFGKYVGIEISSENARQVYIPAGFAHGFCVLSEYAVFNYKCTEYYNPSEEGGLIWNDPNVNIKWPIENPVVSEKDMKLSVFLR